MPATQIPGSSHDANLARVAHLLPIPADALHGVHAPDLALPNSIVCFYHRSAKQMNRPPEGRALHHRYVLMFALETAITVCVDDRSIRLNAGDGLLVLPFQFHNYIEPEQDKITWLFITFEMADGRSLEPLRFRPFATTPVIRQLIRDLLGAYMAPNRAELTILLFALLLVRIRDTDILTSIEEPAHATSNLVIKINQLAQGDGKMPSVAEMARSVGISPSHLRARFRASCGVSLGRHLRRLRMEKACGLLRSGTRRVSEIAEQCGFTSVFSFSRAFRHTYGVSPMAYRRGAGPK